MTTTLFLRDNWRATPDLNEAELKAQSTEIWEAIYGFLSDKPKNTWLNDA